jgi:hypothetical protein
MFCPHQAFRRVYLPGAFTFGAAQLRLDPVMIDVEKLRAEFQQQIQRREISREQYFRQIKAAVAQWKQEQRAQRKAERRA